LEGKKFFIFLISHCSFHSVKIVFYFFLIFHFSFLLNLYLFVNYIVFKCIIFFIDLFIQCWIAICRIFIIWVECGFFERIWSIFLFVFWILFLFYWVLFFIALLLRRINCTWLSILRISTFLRDNITWITIITFWNVFRAVSTIFYFILLLIFRLNDTFIKTWIILLRRLLFFYYFRWIYFLYILFWRLFFCL